MTNTAGDQPRQDGATDALADERLRGILVQVAADHELRPDEDVVAMITERLSDAGITLSPDAIVGISHALPTFGPGGGELQPGSH